MWQALPEGRHLDIAILGKLEISLNDVGMSAGYLAPVIAQIMGKYKLDLITQDVLQFFSFSSTSMDDESRIYLGTHSHSDFLNV